MGGIVDLSGRVALITGASRGIGRGCAVEMARAGADVTVNYRSHGDEAAEVAEEVRGMGRRALVVGADIADRAAVDRMIEETVDRLGRLDIVVANPARSVRGPLLDMPVKAS